MLKSYISREERQDANRQLPRLMVEGLLLGGTGLGVLALIFEIAADAFSVAAYQTLLAIHGADGQHTIAIAAFTVLSVMLFFGIVPAYKAGAYLRPNAGGSGPLVEAIGPPRLRWLSWVGTSLFFLDAVLTIIISSISAADVTMLVLPELAGQRILVAEFYAFFIMAVLVAVGPKRAVPLFLLGGGAFTIFTIFALSMVGATAAGNPQWAFLTEGIVRRLQETGVVDHVVRAQQDFSAIGTVLFFQLFFRSMSSAMLGFSGYEVIPASGKHAARPKWKVINTALTLAAIFLIGTGMVQLYVAQQWKIPSTEGYSTLLIEYEIVAAQMFGRGVDPDNVSISDQDLARAEVLFEELEREALLDTDRELSEGLPEETDRVESVKAIAYNLAFGREIEDALGGTTGESILVVAGILLAIILLLAQGGGYVGGAAVAANAARLGRLPSFFEDDRLGVTVIWGFSAILIPIIREVVVVESFYAFGFVSAFAITSTSVFFVRADSLRDRNIEPGSGEAKSLKFAGLRGMVASYIMLAVLVTMKTEALGFIIVSGVLLTLFQILISRGGVRSVASTDQPYDYIPGTAPRYANGLQRAYDHARQRGIADGVNQMLAAGRMVKFNVGPERIRRLVSYIEGVDPIYWNHQDDHHGERFPEPAQGLEQVYQKAVNECDAMMRAIEIYSHYGIFTFVEKYHMNWISRNRGKDTVLRAMLDLLFPLTPVDAVWEEYKNYHWENQPEEIWQFSRERYRWAKDQWPNLSDRITTVWTLQDLGMIPDDVDVSTVIAVNAHNDLKRVEIHVSGPNSEVAKQSADIRPATDSVASDGEENQL